MDSPKNLGGHLLDLTVILALGIVYVVALAVATVWSGCQDLYRSVKASLAEPRYRADSDESALPTGGRGEADK